MLNIHEILRDLAIDYEQIDHPAVFTCEEADKYYEKMEGGKSKNLFLRNEKGNKHYLVIIESHKRVDFKKMAEVLQEKKISFASEERLKKYLGLETGSVSPFGLINDVNKEVVVIVDNDLMKHDFLHYHPNVNTATLKLSNGNFKKYLEWTGNEIRYLEIGSRVLGARL